MGSNICLDLLAVPILISPDAFGTIYSQEVPKQTNSTNILNLSDLSPKRTGYGSESAASSRSPILSRLKYRAGLTPNLLSELALCYVFLTNHLITFVKVSIEKLD